MKKLTVLTIALSMVLSLGACNSENGGMPAEADVSATAEETVKNEPAAEEKEEKTEEPTETTAAETTETTTAETAAELSETDALVKALIAERAANFDKEPSTQYDDGKLIMFNYTSGGYYHAAVYDTEKKELKKFGNYTTFWKLTYANNKIYVNADSNDNVDDNIYKLLLCDMDCNVISEWDNATFENDIGTFLQYWILDDGRVLRYDQKWKDWGEIDEGENWYLYDSELKNPVKLPKPTVDVGHGMTEECTLYTYNMKCILGNKLYAEYQGKNSGSVKKILNLDTLEFSDPQESDEKSFNDYYDRLTGKYLRNNVGEIYDAETGEIYSNLKNYNDVIVTPEAFYYIDDSKLYKYISEDESELIYDGSQNGATFLLAGDNYVVVQDRLGIFLYDRKTGEETKLDLE